MEDGGVTMHGTATIIINPDYAMNIQYPYPYLTQNIAGDWSNIIDIRPFVPYKQLFLRSQYILYRYSTGVVSNVVLL